MEELLFGKDLTIRPASGRSKPTLVQVGTRVICSDGRVHPPLVADYIKTKGRKQFIGTGELSRVFTGANTTDGKKRIRKQMASVFGELLKHGEFLVYETQINGRIHAVKLLDVTSEAERQAARPQLERMKRNREVSSTKYDRALQVIELQQQVRMMTGA